MKINVTNYNILWKICYLIQNLDEIGQKQVKKYSEKPVECKIINCLQGEKCSRSWDIAWVFSLKWKYYTY